MTADAYIGLGSNIGERLDNLARALREIDALDGVRLVAVSHVYESEPWGVAEQPWFANAAARVHADIPADELLDELKRVERELGREPGGERWGPRVIDLDILLYGSQEWASEELTIPHPRMGERDFVVRPLLEVAPKGLRYPDGRPISKRGWLGMCTNDLGPVPGFEEYRTDTMEARGLTCEAEEGAPSEGGRQEHGAWRTVGTTAGFGRIDTGGGSLAFKEKVLREREIPFVYDPHPPSEGFNPWSVGAQIRLKVPASEHERAMKAIREAEQAEGEGSP